MISKFCPVWHLILIFIRILPLSRTIWAFQGVNQFSNKCSSSVYTKSALDFSLKKKMMLEGHVWMEGQKISRGRGQGGGVESTMDDAMTLIVSVMFDMKMWKCVYSCLVVTLWKCEDCLIWTLKKCLIWTS